MCGMYRRISAGVCALLLSLALAGCDDPVDVDAVLDSLAGSKAPSQKVEDSSRPDEESSHHKEGDSRSEGDGSRQGEGGSQSRPEAASSHRGTHGEEEHQENSGDRPGQTPAPQGSPSAPAEEEALLTEEQAKERALAHAQISVGEVTFTKVKLDWEDGRQVYEIEFVTGDRTEYEYEIDARTGEVLKWERDDDHRPPATAVSTPRPTPQPTPEPTPVPVPEPVGISLEEAKSIALGRVPGASAGDITKFETDYDDGRTVYEGEIVFGGNEYEFEIDGATGAVLEWDMETIYD